MHRLLEIWPSIGAIAEALRLPYPTVAAWTQRGIPPRRYAEIIKAAKERGASLSFEDLAGIATDGAVPADSWIAEPQVLGAKPEEDAA